MDFETFKQNVPTGDYLQMTLLKDDVSEEQIMDWIPRDLWEFLREKFGQVDGEGGLSHGPTGRSR